MKNPILVALALALMAGCSANPTPHPAGGDDQANSASDTTGSVRADTAAQGAENEDDCNSLGGVWDADLGECFGGATPDDGDGGDAAGDVTPDGEADGAGDIGPDAESD